MKTLFLLIEESILEIETTYGSVKNAKVFTSAFEAIDFVKNHKQSFRISKSCYQEMNDWFGKTDLVIYDNDFLPIFHIFVKKI